MTKRNQPDMKQLGAVLALGVLAGYGARYVASKMRPETQAGPATGPTVRLDQQGQLIDWEQARSIALRVSQWDQHPVHNRAEREAQYQRLVEQSQPLISNYLEAHLPAPFTRVRVFDRREWLEANIISFSYLFKPVEELYQRAALKRGAQPNVSALNQKLFGVQVGVMLGFLARKVLGQYDLSLLSPEAQPGALYFVEPNIAGVQEGLKLDHEQFRLWITLHEMTHTYQFEAYPWVREHFQSLLTEYLNQLSDNLTMLGNGVASLLNRILQGKGREQTSHWIESLMTPRQREIFNQLQAMMSVVEGYSNHIMNAIGRQLLPSFDQIEARMHERQRNRSLIDQIFFRVTGMSLKMEQYQQGEAFVNAVADARGRQFAAKVWEGPQFLPTMEEIRNPQRWISRVEGM